MARMPGAPRLVRILPGPAHATCLCPQSEHGVRLRRSPYDRQSLGSELEGCSKAFQPGLDQQSQVELLPSTCAAMAGSWEEAFRSESHTTALKRDTAASIVRGAGLS